MEWSHIPQLASLAAIDSVNILAFAVIAGLWLSMRDRPTQFAPRAAQFTGGAFLGILSLAALSVWVIGSNQDVFRTLWNNPIAAVLALLLGIVLLILGLRQPSPESTESAPTTTASPAPATPLPRSALQKVGLAGTGVALGIIQSGTSVPFAAGVVVISFANTPLVQQILEIIVFALVAITPSALLITVLSRVRGESVARATAAINRFMRRAKALGRLLTVLVACLLVVLGLVRLVQLDVIG